jgi:ABC-type transporter Mla subunit MlaD
MDVQELRQALTSAMAARDQASERVSKLEVARDEVGERANELSEQIHELEPALAKARAAHAVGDAGADNVSTLRETLEVLQRELDEALETKTELLSQAEQARAKLKPQHRAVARAVEDLARVLDDAMSAEAMRLARAIQALLTSRVRLAALAAQECARAGLHHHPVLFETPGQRLLRGRIAPGSDADIRDLLVPRSLDDCGPLTLAELLAMAPVSNGGPKKRTRPAQANG